MINGVRAKGQKFFKQYKSMNVAVKASLWFTVCSIIQRGISVITLPVFTRLMSTYEFGRYSVFLSWYNILLLIVTLNVHTEMFNKGLIEHSEEKDKYTANQAGLLIVLSAISFIVYAVFHKPLNFIMGLNTPLFIAILMEILGTAIFGLWCARQRFEFKYKKMVILTLAMSIMTPLIGILGVCITDKQAEAKVYSNAVFPVLIAVILLVMIAKKGSLVSPISWWKTAVVAAIPLVPHYLSLVLLNQSDKLMIDSFIGAEFAAIYSIAHSAGLLMTIVNNSVNGSFVPWSYRKMKEENGRGIKKVSTSLMCLIMAVNLLLMWIAPEAIRILAAPQYAEAVYCLVPIAISVYFYFAYTLFVDIEIYYGANHYVAIASVVAAATNIVLNYLFIPMYGYIAAGYTTLASYFITMIMHYCFLSFAMKKQSDIRVKDLFDIKAILLIGMVLVALSFIAVALYKHMLVRWSILIVVAGVVSFKRKMLLETVKQIRKGKLRK